MRILGACLMVVILAVTGALPLAAQDAVPPAFSTQDEQAFVDYLNQTRTDAGLPALKVDTGLVDAARSWALWMGERRELRHADDIVTGAPADWTKAGENVGRGGAVSAVWQAFMDSPSHAANVLDPAYTRIGIGVVRTSDGMLYTTHRFAGAVSDQEPAPTPPAVAVAEPAQTGGSVDDAPPEQLVFLDGDGLEANEAAPAQPGDSGPQLRGADPMRLTTTMQLLLDAAN